MVDDFIPISVVTKIISDLRYMFIRTDNAHDAAVVSYIEDLIDRQKVYVLEYRDGDCLFYDEEEYFKRHQITEEKQ